MSKFNGKGKLVAAIMLCAIVGQINTIASVMLTGLAADFPTATSNDLQWVMQMGMLGGFLISLAMTFLSRKFRKKPMILIGEFLILIGGAVPILIHNNLYLLWVCALVVGIGQGFITPLLGSLILLNFEGETQNKVLGLNSFFGTGGAAVLSAVAGIVATTGWINVYYIYFLVIPVIIGTLLLMPMDPKPSEMFAPEQKSKSPVPLVGVIQCVLAVLIMISYATFPLNLSFVVEGGGLGTAAEVGYGMTAVTVVGALVGLFLNQIIKVCKLFVAGVGCVFGLAATLCVVFAPNIIVIYIAALLDGVFFGIVMAAGGYVIGRIVKPDQMASTFSLSMSFVSLGTGFCPTIMNGITGLWSSFDPVTQIPDFAHDAFVTSAVWFAVVMVLEFIWGAYLTKRFPEKAPEGAAKG